MLVIHLGPAGDSRSHGVAKGKVRDHRREFFYLSPDQRARADEAHVARKHVPHLRDFIEPDAPDESADRCDPRIIPLSRELPVVVGPCSHGPELKQHEGFAVQADPRLPVQNSARRVELNGKCDQKAEGERREQPAERHDYVGDAFELFIINTFLYAHQRRKNKPEVRHVFHRDLAREHLIERRHVIDLYAVELAVQRGLQELRLDKAAHGEDEDVNSMPSDEPAQCCASAHHPGEMGGPPLQGIVVDHEPHRLEARIGQDDIVQHPPGLAGAHDQHALLPDRIARKPPCEQEPPEERGEADDDAAGQEHASSVFCRRDEKEHQHHDQAAEDHARQVVEEIARVGETGVHIVEFGDIENEKIRQQKGGLGIVVVRQPERQMPGAQGQGKKIGASDDEHVAEKKQEDFFGNKFKKSHDKRRTRCFSISCFLPACARSGCVSVSAQKGDVIYQIHRFLSR